MGRSGRYEMLPDEQRDFYESPLGLIEVRADEHGVTYLMFTDKDWIGAESPKKPSGMSEKGIKINSVSYQGKQKTTAQDDSITAMHLSNCIQQLDEYFKGERTEFSLSLSLKGTEFQKKVWESLLSVKHGKTTCYEDIALKIGNAKACRAVGTAIGRNPVFIVVPCHRIIGKYGSLTCYACGVERKRWLLEHEKAIGSDISGN